MCGWSLSPPGMSACSATFLPSENLCVFSCKHETFAQVRHLEQTLKLLPVFNRSLRVLLMFIVNRLGQTKWSLTGLCIVSCKCNFTQNHESHLTVSQTRYKFITIIFPATLQTYTSTVIIIPTVPAYIFFH